MKKLLLCIAGIIFTLNLNAGDDFCGIRNHTFKAGESLSFNVYYSVAGIYVNAGTAVFNLTLERLNNRPVYHVTGIGTSNSSYDWIVKVRDRYETFFDTLKLQPVKFIRSVD